MADLRAEAILGEHLRYYVHSQTHGDETHVVDLLENDGNGACSCRDFETRRGPNYHKNGKQIVEYAKDEKGKVVAGASRCKHINAAVFQYANDMLRREAAHATKRAKPTTIKERSDSLPF